MQITATVCRPSVRVMPERFAVSFTNLTREEVMHLQALGYCNSSVPDTVLRVLPHRGLQASVLCGLLVRLSQVTKVCLSQG